MVTVTDNGPYAVTGGVELMGVEFGDGATGRIGIPASGIRRQRAPDRLIDAAVRKDCGSMR